MIIKTLVLSSFLALSAPEPLQTEPVVKFNKVKVQQLHPVVRFLKKDIWSLYKWAKPCASRQDVKICAGVDAKGQGKVMFTWSF